MIDKIIDSIGGRENTDVKNWYQSKLKEAAYFLINQIKPIEKSMPDEKKELEVMVK